MNIVIFSGKSFFTVLDGVREHNTDVISANLHIQSCFQVLLILRK